MNEKREQARSPKQIFMKTIREILMINWVDHDRTQFEWLKHWEETGRMDNLLNRIIAAAEPTTEPTMEPGEPIAVDPGHFILPVAVTVEQLARLYSLFATIGLDGDTFASFCNFIIGDGTWNLKRNLAPGEQREFALLAGRKRTQLNDVLKREFADG